MRRRFGVAAAVAGVVLCLAVGDAFASPPTNPALETGTLLRLTGGLVLVIVVIVGLSWFLRRFGGFAASAGGRMRVLGSMPLGGRERMVLVQVGDKQLLLGVAPGRVQTLHVLDEPVDATDAIRPGRDVQPGDSFAERLRRLMQQNEKR